MALWPRAEARQTAGGYQVVFHNHRDGSGEQRVTAPLDFLAAGTLGTTELLLRSQNPRRHATNPRSLLEPCAATSGTHGF